MAKVAFVSIMWHSRFVEELGVEYLTAVLRKETNHEVRIFYKFPEDNYNDFFQQVIGFNPDIVGISLSHKYTGLEPLYAGASLLKEKLPEVYLCIGGILHLLMQKISCVRYKKLTVCSLVNLKILLLILWIRLLIIKVLML